MQKAKSILYGFHDDDLESFIKRALQAQGYEVVSTVKYGISSIVQYAADNPIDAIIMRCNTMSELEKARDLRDLNATLILLVTAGMRGTPEIEEALSSGLNNIVFAGLRSHSKNLRTEIVDIIREERSQKQARVYYGFAPLERPACFSGELSIKNEQQLLMLYEYLLDKTDPRELDVRFEKVLGMLPAEERSEMARTLPVPIKSLLRDSVSYQQAMTPERKKKGGFFRKKQEEPQEDSAGTEVALSGSSNLMDTINQLVEQYHHHQFGEWEVVRPATEQEEGEERRRCVCGHEEIRTIPRIAASIPQKEEEERVSWGPEERMEPTCEKAGRVFKRGNDGNIQIVCEIPPLGHIEETKAEKEPDCAHEGVLLVRCTRCGKELRRETIPPTGQHIWSDWTIEAEPTCNTEGVRKHHCKVCGFEEEQSISTTEHSYEKIIGKKPTCKEDGYYNLKCTKCGHLQENVESIPSTGQHVWSDWQVVKVATCKEDGLKERYCTACGEKEAVSLPQKTHEYQKIIIKKAVCQKDGVYDLECIHCGDRQRNAGTIPAPKEHNFVKRLIRVATCTNPGLCEERCSICGLVQKEEIAAAHQPRGKGVLLKQATCTEEGTLENICAVCGQTYTVPIPCRHAYGKWVRIQSGTTCAEPDIKERVCTICGKTEQEKSPSNNSHNYEWFVEMPATCDKNGRAIEICTTCGATRKSKKIQASGHQYGEIIRKEATCTESGEVYQMCKRCQYKKKLGVLDPTGHDMYKEIVKEPTCHKPGKYRILCRNCQMVTEEGEIESLGHDYGSEIIKKEPTCTTQGEEYQVCNRCQAKKILHITPELGHKPKKIVLVPPSCSESGKYQMICERCSEAVSEEETIPELDHDFSEWTIQKAADCEHTGERVRTCKKCGIQESRTISKLGHEWVDKKTLPTCIAEGRLERVCMRCGKTELVETLPVAGHAFGKWKMSGFKDTRTCEVCGKVESRTAYKRIVAVAVCGAAIVGVAGVAIFLKKSASSEGSDYMDSKNVVHSTALIDESRESGETVSDFSKADLQVANDGKATSAATLTSAAFEEESETVEAVTETIEEGSDTLVQETDSEEETISAEAFTEEAKEDSQKWESTFEESRIESSESQTTELEIESTQPESIEFTSEAVMPEETDYGAITNLFLPTTLKTPETLQQLLTDWESRRKLLHWDTGILGDSSAYLVSQAQLEKLSASANGEIANWQENEQNTVAEIIEEQASEAEALPEAQSSASGN